LQLQFKDNDLYSYGANNDGVHYTLAMHKSARLLLFGKFPKNVTESELKGCCVWVDANSNGRYQVLDESRVTKLVPAEFVRAKYIQAQYFFERLEDIQNEIDSRKEAVDKDELALETDSYLIRLVKSLIHDVMDAEHISETIQNEMKLTIRNVVDNQMYLPEFVKRSDLIKNNNNEWLCLKFNNNNYRFDKVELLSNVGSKLYYFAIHKTLNQIIIARDLNSKFSTTEMHHLYINQDDGLGRYKVLIKDGIILKQFFVPIDYVAYRYNRFREFMDEFKKVQLQATSDVYTSQANWCKLQDDAIHLMNYTLGELERDLKQEIDKSLDHQLISLDPSMPDIKNFEDFYRKAVEREKRIRVQLGEKIYPHRLIIFNRHKNAASEITLNALEKDVFLVEEKVRILVSKYASDYYLIIGEGWMPKNIEVQQHISKNYQHGNIQQLSRHDKTEILIFVAKTKDSTNLEPDKSEIYEIVRKKQNDEKSRILGLRKIDVSRLESGMEHQASIGIEA
jgi:hypothetical protein